MAFGLYERAQLVTGLFIYPPVCVIGIIGNILSFIVLNHCKRIVSSTNTYLKCLGEFSLDSISPKIIVVTRT